MNILEQLYNTYYNSQCSDDIRNSIKQQRKILHELLSEDDHKHLLRLIDAYELLITSSTEESFKQGFILAYQLAIEIHHEYE